jgi:hypothetical protein
MDFELLVEVSMDFELLVEVSS